jgi:hypothetical protein
MVCRAAMHQHVENPDEFHAVGEVLAARVSTSFILREISRVSLSNLPILNRKHG